MCESSTLERITDLLMTLPEERAREVLLFAESMTARQQDDETAYLLKHRANADDLRAAMEELRERRVISE